MINHETSVDYIATSAYTEAINNIINLQAISSLLVEKGIITVDDIARMRKSVMDNNETLLTTFGALKNRLEVIDHQVKFEDSMTKVLSGEATPEERNFVMEQLDKYKNNMKEDTNE